MIVLLLLLLGQEAWDMPSQLTVVLPKVTLTDL